MIDTIPGIWIKLIAWNSSHSKNEFNPETEMFFIPISYLADTHTSLFRSSSKRFKLRNFR